jgi:transcriptional regulator with XRE-family HTH domain
LSEDWSTFVRRYRARHGLTQAGLGSIVGVAQRTVSRWERGEDRPSLEQQRLLRDLGMEPTTALFQILTTSVANCPAPRALSRIPNLRLLVLSQPAIDKRPSVVDWVGRDLAGIACGVLAEMLEDKPLQRGIAKREIACVTAITRSVLRTAEHARIGAYRTTITYFSHDGTVYSDAISVPASPDAPLGYRPIAMDDIARP